MEQRTKKKKTYEQRRRKKIWRAVRPAAVLLVSIIAVFFVAKITLNYVLAHYINPVDVNDATPIEVVIPKSSSASTIARILYNARGQDEEGLIPNTAVFKVYVDFVGKANKMQAGTYILSRNMTMKQIVDIICAGNPPKATVAAKAEDAARKVRRSMPVPADVLISCMGPPLGGLTGLAKLPNR